MASRGVFVFAFDEREKKAYITWEDNDMDSSEDSENEVVNLSLMAKNYESEEEVTSSNNNLFISFDEHDKKNINNT